MALSLTSPRFHDQGALPSDYTSDGKDVSPPLAWAGAPVGTKSFALVVDDPDAPDPAHPKMTWVHWVLHDLPPTATSLPEGATSDTLPKGTRVGRNDWKRAAWGGPSPPIGRHRYFFKLYALDAVLGDLGSPTKARLEAAIEGHVLARAQLVGTYEKLGARR
jgi:Raf kinase inhibitor-like YbhB/YbcL family protein